MCIVSTGWSLFLIKSMKALPRIQLLESHHSQLRVGRDGELAFDVATLDLVCLNATACTVICHVRRRTVKTAAIDSVDNLIVNDYAAHSEEQDAVCAKVVWMRSEIDCA